MSVRFGIELHAGAARCRQDASPVRIGAGKHRLHQRRVRRWCAPPAPRRASLGAPRTSISITRLAPSPSATICSASEWHTCSSAVEEALIVRRPRERSTRFPALPLARTSTVSFVEVSPSTVMALNVVGHHGRERALQKRLPNGRVGHDVREHRRHIRMDHPRALGAAQQADRFAAEPAARRRPFRPRVGGHDGAGEAVEGRRGPRGSLGQAPARPCGCARRAGARR